MLLLFNIFLISIYITYCIKIYNRNPSHILVISYIIFQKIWLLLSVMYLDMGIYVHDYMSSSYFTGSTFRLFVLEMTFLASFSFFASKFQQKNKADGAKIISNGFDSNFLINSFLLVLFLILLIQITDVIISGNILTNPNITRFNFYSKYSKIGFAATIEMLMLYIQFVNGMIFINRWKINKRQGMASLLALIIYLIYRYLMGIQASGFIITIIYFFTPYMVLRINKKIHFKFGVSQIKVVLGAFIGAVVLLIPKYEYMKTAKIYTFLDSPLSMLMYRMFALQGETWWRVDSQIYSGSISVDPTQIVCEFAALLNSDLRYQSGIWYVAQYVYDYNIGYSLSNASQFEATLNNGHPAIFVLILGYIGTFFVQILFGLLATILAHYLTLTIIKKQYIRGFLASILLYHFTCVVTMGGLWYIGNLIPMVALFAILIIEFLSRKQYISNIAKEK